MRKDKSILVLERKKYVYGVVVVFIDRVTQLEYTCMFEVTIPVQFEPLDEKETKQETHHEENKIVSKCISIWYCCKQ